METQNLKEKHIILRSIGAITRDVFDGGAASFPSSVSTAFPNSVESATASTAGLSVEIKDIDRDNISALTRNSDVLAVAPSIPMKLIEPLDIEDVAEPIAMDKAWGVKAVGADTSPFSGKGIVVAVLDTGIDASHPVFSGISIIQKDFTGEGDGDQNGHGTHCAGTIFGRTITGSPRIGIAPGVEKVLIGKVIGKKGGSSDQIVSAIQWAVDNGANVISMSLGMDFPGLVKQLEQNGFPPELAASRALEGYRTNILLFERLAALVRAQGAFLQATVIVAASGNESRRNINPKFEISASPPAVSEGIISVGALGEGPVGLTIADFSNTGPNISGPGVKILSAKAGGGYTLMSGTSMATPHVAGVAALWAEKINAFGNLNSLQLTARIIASGTNDELKVGFDSFDVGAGLVRAPQV